MQSNLATAADVERHAANGEPKRGQPKSTIQHFSIMGVALGVFIGNVLTALVVTILYVVLKSTL